MHLREKSGVAPSSCLPLAPTPTHGHLQVKASLPTIEAWPSPGHPLHVLATMLALIPTPSHDTGLVVRTQLRSHLLGRLPRPYSQAEACSPPP